jgi:integrase
MAKVSKRRGRYVVDYRDRDRIRRWEPFQTRGEADKRLEEILKGLREGTFRPPSEIPTFEETAKEWLETKRGRRVASLLQWQTHADVHLVPALGKVRLDKITVAMIERRRDRLRSDGLAPRTVNKILTTATAVFALAVRRGYVSMNPAQVAERLRCDDAESAAVPSDTPRARTVEVTEADVLAIAEVRKLIQNASTGRDKALVMTLALTGARIGEATALTWPDIELDEARVHIRRSVSWAKERGVKGAPDPRFYEPKTKAGRRTIQIPAALVAELRRWKLACPPTDNDLVFPSANGTPVHRSVVRSHVLQPALERAGLRTDVTVHSLRHSFATALIQQGTTVNEVAGLLGHSTPDITMRVYTHWLHGAASSSIDRLAEAIVGETSSAEGK